MDMAQMAAMMQEETLELLRNKSVLSTLTERIFLLDEAWKELEDKPQPLQEGLGLRYVIERCSLPIAPYDLLLGRFVDKVPDEAEEARFQALVAANRLRTNPLTNVNHSHMTLDWDHVIAHGLPGYVARAQARIEKAKAEGEDEKTLIFLQGMLEVYKACVRYVERYGEAAAAAGRQDLADICAALAKGAPQTFHQGVQLMLFVLTLYYIYIGGFNSTLCYGRMDELLLPLYEGDLAAGRITREQAGYILDDFNCKCNLTLGRGEHQMADPSQGGNITGWERSHVFDDPTYVMVGGYTMEGYRENPLTSLMLERIQPRHENPVYIHRTTKHDSPELWRLICDKLRQNASLLVYNDETMLPALRSCGVSEEDAVSYTIHACNWPDVPSHVNMSACGGWLPQMIMEALMEDGRLKRDYPDMDSIYAAVADIFRANIRAEFTRLRQRYGSGRLPASDTLSMTSCFVDGPLDAARDMRDGGVRHSDTYVLIRSVGSAADMLAALDLIVYQQKACTLEEMAAALACDFENDPRLKALCRKMPKFGQDDDRADGHGVKLMNMMLDIVDEERLGEKGEPDVWAFPVTITDMNHRVAGARLGATPDGRGAGVPISENLSPTPGYMKGVTALMNSVAKLPFDRLCAGAFNLRMKESMVRGEAGLDQFCALARTYFDNGGMQLQVSIADTAVLREAQAHPEDYKDLMVRITGYSAVFVDMSRNAQEEFIRRDELDG